MAALAAAVLLAACGGEVQQQAAVPKKQAPRAERSLVAGVRTAQGVILQVRKMERLSPTEAKFDVRIFNPGAVPLPQKVGPEYFYIGANQSTELPKNSVLKDQTTLPSKELVPRTATEGQLVMQLPDAGEAVLYYGETPEVNVFVVRIPAAGQT